MINLFLGASKTGKSHTLLSVAKVLSSLGKVLVIDTTLSQGIFSYIEVDNLEKNLDVYSREFDILKDYKKNSLELVNKYRYILVEADKTVNQKLLNHAEHIFLVQNYDADCLNKNLDILVKNNEFIMEDKFNIVFNQILDESKLNVDIMYGELISKMKNKFKATENDYVTIPFSIEDLIFACNNRINGRFNFSQYSKVFKEGLYKIIHVINDEIDEKRFNTIKL